MHCTKRQKRRTGKVDLPPLASSTALVRTCPTPSHRSRHADAWLPHLILHFGEGRGRGDREKRGGHAVPGRTTTLEEALSFVAACRRRSVVCRHGRSSRHGK